MWLKRCNWGGVPDFRSCSHDSPPAALPIVLLVFSKAPGFGTEPKELTQVLVLGSICQGAMLVHVLDPQPCGVVTESLQTQQEKRQKQLQQMAVGGWNPLENSGFAVQILIRASPQCPTPIDRGCFPHGGKNRIVQRPNNTHTTRQSHY